MKLHVHELRAGAGRPIVLLHGWMGAGSDFEAVARSSGLEGRTVLAVDLPGHGETPDHDREYDFSDVAPWVAETIDADVFDLVGYSMGGRLALYLAATHRSRVATMTLIGAHPGIEHPIEQRRRLELDAERATQLLAEPNTFLEEWGTLPLFGPREADAWQQVQARRDAQASSHAFAWGRALICLSLGRQIPLWNIATSLALPTTYVAGELDEKYVEIGQRFAGANADYTRFHAVNGANHAVHLDAPTEVARLIAG